MDEKVALITGASRGIGAEICRAFAKRGYFVAINCRKKNEYAEKLASEISVSGHGCELIEFDVTNNEQVTKAAKQFNHDRLDVLVNNAGILKDNLIYAIKKSDWETVLSTNFWGCVNTYQAFQKKLTVSAPFVVISMGSISGIKPKKGQGAYSVSKAMVIEWTKCMAELEEQSGGKFYAVSPGPVATEMIKDSFWYQDPESVKRIPLRRYASPVEIARAVCFLASPACALANGSNFVIDGGFTQALKD